MTRETLPPPSPLNTALLAGVFLKNRYKKIAVICKKFNARKIYLEIKDFNEKQIKINLKMYLKKHCSPVSTTPTIYVSPV
jgi:hypothetical protein